MSRILNRPMFRGGGKVSSYGTGIASGLADGGMADKRGLVDGPGGYAGVGTTGGFGDSILARSGRYLKDYALNPFLNVINQDIANPLMGLAGYGDVIPRLETPYDDKYLLGLDENFKKIPVDEREKFSDRYLNDGLGPIETDSGAIPKESAKQAAMIEREKYNDLVKKQKEAMDKGPTKLTDEEKLAEVEKDQAFFEKLLGGGKEAKIQDASDMALSFAGKAFKEGATTKSAFGEFFEEESKRPSRRMKVKDAATQAAIQSYLTGKTSLQKFQDQLGLYEKQLEIKDKFEKKDLDIDALLRAEAGNNGKVTNEGVMARSFDRKYKDVPGYTGFKGEVKPDKELIEGGIYYVTEGNDRIVYIVKSGKLEEIKTIFN